MASGRISQGAVYAELATGTCSSKHLPTLSCYLNRSGAVFIEGLCEAPPLLQVLLIPTFLAVSREDIR